MTHAATTAWSTGAAQHAARSIEQRRSSPAGVRPFRAIVGFDGFIDTIIDVVRQRNGAEPRAFDRFETLTEFGRRVQDASGRSTNIELFERERRFGGNGPLMAGALGRLGAQVTYIGAVGRDDQPRELEPAFAEFASRCARVVPIAAPGRTDAFEFGDGKINFNRPLPLLGVNWQSLLGAIGPAPLRELVAASDLLAVVNWSLVLGTDGILDGLLAQVLEEAPDDRGVRVQTAGGVRRPAVFIEMSAGARRPLPEIAALASRASALAARSAVTFAMNRAEGQRLAESIGLPQVARTLEEHDRGESLAGAASALREALRVHRVVIHSHHGAAGAEGAAGAVWADGFFTPRPMLSTGAGDHFNAGVSWASGLGLGLAECLTVGCAVAGRYVRTGSSPDLPSVMGFLRDDAITAGGVGS